MKFNELHTIVLSEAASKPDEKGKLVALDDLPKETQNDIFYWLAEEEEIPELENDEEWAKNNMLMGTCSDCNPLMLRVYDAKLSDIQGYKKRNMSGGQVAIANFVKRLQAGSEAPPILVANGDFLDGGHRAHAYEKAGRTHIPAVDITPLLKMNWETWMKDETDDSHPVRSKSPKPNPKDILDSAEGETIDPKNLEIKAKDGRYYAFVSVETSDGDEISIRLGDNYSSSQEAKIHAEELIKKHNAAVK